MLKDRIKEKRKERGLIQQQLADKMEVSIDTIKSWESGRRTHIDGENIRRLALFLHTTEEYLLTGKNDFPNWVSFDNIYKDDVTKIRTEMYFYNYCESLGCKLELLTSKREPTTEEIEQYKKTPPSERDSSIFADFSLQNELLNDSTEFIKCKYNELIKRKEDDLNEYEGSKND